MIPPEFTESLKALSVFELAVAVIAVIAALWALWRAGRWLIERFFPGVIAFARAIVNAAAILAAVKDLPDFIERTDNTLAEQNSRLADQTERLAGQQEQVSEIHHEVHFNNGSSVKDAVIRMESVVGEVRVSVAGIHGRLDVVEAHATRPHPISQTSPSEEQA